MSTKKLNFNKEEWKKKWDKEPTRYSWGDEEENEESIAGAPRLSSARSAGKSPLKERGAPSVKASYAAGAQRGAGRTEVPPAHGSFAASDMRSDEKSKKRLLPIFFTVAAIVLFFAAALTLSLAVRSCKLWSIPGGTGNGAERANTLALARRYIDRAEYDRAMNLLDQLLIQNAQDAEALALSDEILALKAAQGISATASSGGSVSVDTSGIEKAVGRIAEENARAARESAKNTAALTEALKQREGQAGSASSSSGGGVSIDTSGIEKAVGRIAEENARAARESAKGTAALTDAVKKQEERARFEEEERAAQKRSREQAAAEEAKRKAHEQQLAKQNADLQKLIKQVNDEIASGKSGLLSGRYNEALNDFAKAAALLPPDQKELSGGKLAEIAGLLSTAAKNEPDAAKQKKLKNEALNYAQKSLEFTPDNPVSHYVMGKAAADVGDHKNALKEFSLAAQKDTSNPLYFYELGKAQYTMKKYGEARSSFESAAKLDSSFHQAWFNAALAYNRLGNIDEAITALRKAVGANPHYDSAWLQLARFQTQKGDNTGAIASYKKLLDIDSTHTGALRELGSLYGSQKNYAESEKYFKRALSYADTDPLTNYNLSTALFELKKFDEALAYARKAVNAEPNNAVYQYNYGLINESLGRFSEAIKAYAASVQIDAAHVKANINLGRLYLDNGNAENALKYLLKAVELDNSSFEAVNNLAGAYLAKKDYANAVKHFLAAVKLESKNETAKMNLAGAYASSGQFDSAKSVYLEVLQQNQRNSEAYVELAKVCIALQDNKSAEKYLITVQAKDPAFRKKEVAALLESVQ